MIRVRGPDGSTFNFPEGTDEQTINQTLDAHYRQSQSPPAAQQTPQGAVGAPKTPQLASAAIGAADVGLAGFADELGARNEAIGGALARGDFSTAGAKALGYLTAPGRALYQAVGLNTLAKDYSDDPREAARRQELRQISAAAAADNPLSYLAGGLAGGVAVAPAFGAAGAGAARAGVFGNRVRAAQALPSAPARTALQRFAVGAAAGAPQGAAYGYGAGEG